MLGVQNNPFHKANPFRLVQYQRFEHPHLSGSRRHSQYHPNLHKDHHRPQLARPLENNWTFNQNNLDKKYDFSRRPELTNSRVSDFEMKMKMSNIGVPNKSTQRAAHMQDSRMDNPFFRKNLLIDKEEVINQVELDVSLYRNKTKSSYESVPITVANNQTNYQESPVIAKPRISFSEYDGKTTTNPQQGGNSPLDYSPDLTNRGYSFRSMKPEEPEPAEEKEHPDIITFKGKKFFLN